MKLDDDPKSRVRQLAHSRRRSPHWLMHEAIRQYVEREEARESFHQEAQQSWTVYQETRQHVTGAEARAWLNDWGSEAETEPPECHG